MDKNVKRNMTMREFRQWAKNVCESVSSTEKGNNIRFAFYENICVATNIKTMKTGKAVLKHTDLPNNQIGCAIAYSRLMGNIVPEVCENDVLITDVKKGDSIIYQGRPTMVYGVYKDTIGVMLVLKVNGVFNSSYYNRDTKVRRIKK